ncbi:MAG: hypothetical protein LC730_07320, partial [Acidobacteria bacterium]|nr:hypothetical protein [Acidobacteriota bacterium]
MDDFQAFALGPRSVNVIPVIETMPGDLLTPLAVFLKLGSDKSHSFLLESVAGGESVARYSFIGVDPETVICGNDRRVNVVTRHGARRVEIGVLDFLRRHFHGRKVESDESLPSYIGGAIGFLEFSCARWFEPSLNEVRASADEACFMFFRSIVAFDHAKQEIKIVCLVFADEAKGDDAELEKLFRKARTK